MRKIKLSKFHNIPLPVFVEKDEDGFYIVECPLFKGCFTQGKTMDQALKNIKEVIELVIEEKDAQKVLNNYQPRELSIHTITLR